MIQWPSIPLAGAVEAVAEPVMVPTFDERDVEATLMPELPDSGSRQETGESPLIASVEKTGESDGRAPSARRRRWSIAAILLSTMAHAAAIYAVADYLAPDGFEAEIDPVSVIIVVDSQPDPAEQPAIAGDASETIEARAPEERPLESEPAADIVAETTPDEVVSEDASTDIVTEEILPEFSPLPPLADLVMADVEPQPPARAPPVDTAVAQEPRAAPELRAGAPVLTAAPSIEAKLPDIPFPTQQPAMESVSQKQKAGEAAPDTSMKPVEPKPREAEPKPARKETRAAEHPKPPAREKPDRAKTATAPAKSDTVKSDKAKPDKVKPDKVKPGTVAAKDKGKAQAASRAGAVASAKASAGQREAYGRKVNGHVQRFRRYPGEAARQRITGAVRVSISISGSGSLAAASVQASSGYPMLDKEALATVRRAAPYPKPPEGFGGSARFSLTLRFSK